MIPPPLPRTAAAREVPCTPTLRHHRSKPLLPILLTPESCEIRRVCSGTKASVKRARQGGGRVRSELKASVTADIQFGSRILVVPTSAPPQQQRQPPHLPSIPQGMAASLPNAAGASPTLASYNYTASPVPTPTTWNEVFRNSKMRTESVEKLAPIFTEWVPSLVAPMSPTVHQPQASADPHQARHTTLPP